MLKIIGYISVLPFFGTILITAQFLYIGMCLVFIFPLTSKILVFSDLFCSFYSSNFQYNILEKYISLPNVVSPIRSCLKDGCCLHRSYSNQGFLRLKLRSSLDCFSNDKISWSSLFKISLSLMNTGVVSTIVSFSARLGHHKLVTWHYWMNIQNKG